MEGTRGNNVAIKMWCNAEGLCLYPQPLPQVLGGSEQFGVEMGVPQVLKVLDQGRGTFGCQKRLLLCIIYLSFTL